MSHSTDATARPAASRRSRARVEPVAPAVGDHDRGAGLGQPARAREAESLRRARDDGDLPAQVDERETAVSVLRASATVRQRDQDHHSDGIEEAAFMATLLIGYDTESAAVGEGLARFIGPDVPQYRAALDPDTTRRGVAPARAPARGARGAVHVLRLRPHAAARARRDRAARGLAALRHPAAHLQPRRLPRRALPAPRAPRPRRCFPRRRTSRCARSCGSRRS